MTAVSAYVHDSAIGATHDSLVARLTKLRHGVADSYQSDGLGDGDEADTPLEDVFSIMEYHSRVMDKILEACFLKMKHRGLGGTSLVECLDTILRVGRLVADLRDGRIDEGHGERRLSRLIERWGQCSKNLVRTTLKFFLFRLV